MLKVKEKAIKKIESYSTTIGETEIGGLLLGKITEDGDIIVKDAILLEMIQTQSSFEINDDALMEITKNSSGKFLKSILGWWHSHHVMDVFWSCIDTNTFSRLCNFSNQCVGVVVSYDKKTKKLKEKWRVTFKNKDGNLIDIDNIKRTVIDLRSYFVNGKQISEEIKNKVKEDNSFWQTCGTCDGLGYTKPCPTCKGEGGKYTTVKGIKKIGSKIYDDYVMLFGG